MLYHIVVSICYLLFAFAISLYMLETGTGHANIVAAVALVGFAAFVTGLILAKQIAMVRGRGFLDQELNRLKKLEKAIVKRSKDLIWAENELGMRSEELREFYLKCYEFSVEIDRINKSEAMAYDIDEARDQIRLAMDNLNKAIDAHNQAVEASNQRTKDFFRKR